VSQSQNITLTAISSTLMITAATKVFKRVKQVEFIGEYILPKYVKGSNPIQSLVSAKMIQSL